MSFGELFELWLSYPWVKSLLFIVGGALVAVVTNFLLRRVLIRIVRRTKTEVDDNIAAALERPIFATCLLVGFSWGTEVIDLPEPLPFVVSGVTKSLIVVYWSLALSRIARLLLGWLAENKDRFRMIEDRTVPIFEIVAKILIAGGAVYLVLLTWHINVTGWLASAGVVGIAVGFAAKDTLANLFSGVFILADSPYKLGDYVILGTGQRGRVTDIGIRSTRVLTRDDIEIIVPNAVIANSKIVNESGGPYEKERIRCPVSVAYGSDIDLVEQVLLNATRKVVNIVSHPKARVRFRKFGDSGLEFEVLGWIRRPELRGLTLHSLHREVYKHLNEAGIEIPYPKHDVYVKELPGASSGVPVEADE